MLTPLLGWPDFKWDSIVSAVPFNGDLYSACPLSQALFFHVSDLGQSLLIGTNLAVWDPKRALEIGNPPSVRAPSPHRFRKAAWTGLAGCRAERPRGLPTHRAFSATKADSSRTCGLPTAPPLPATGLLRLDQGVGL